VEREKSGFGPKWGKKRIFFTNAGTSKLKRKTP